VALIIATLSVSALLGACADDDATTTVQGTPFRARPSDAAGVTDLGDAPVTMFRRSQLFWSGSSVLFFGSDARRRRTDTNAGGSFEPSTGKWTRWPSAPFDAPLVEEGTVWTVAIEAYGPDERAWTGSRYVFWKAGGSVSGAAGPPVPGGGANQVVWADGVAHLTQRDEPTGMFSEHPRVIAFEPVASERSALR
jgi:hypothetical protein